MECEKKRKKECLILLLIGEINSVLGKKGGFFF